MRTTICLSLLMFGIAGWQSASAVEGRPLQPDDYYRFLDVSDPEVAPDGAAVAYVVTTNDRSSDAARSAVWIVNWDGSGRRALTQGESATRPRFSPDGRYVSFLSARPTDSTTQVWLLDRQGGEARQLTHVSGDVSNYSWSPDSRRLLIVAAQGDAESGKGTKPIVLDAYHFKADEIGYLTAATRRHLALVDVATGTVTALTDDAHDDRDAVWSPDGALIAFVGNHATDGERSGLDEIYLIDPRAGAAPRKLASVYSPNAQHLAFSPDGRLLSLLQGLPPRYNAYIADRLALVTVATGAVRPLTDRLDQQVSSPAFTADGTGLTFMVEDQGAAYLARAAVSDGSIARVTPESVTITGQSTAGGHTVVLATSDAAPPELEALDGGALRGLGAHNQTLMAELRLTAVEDTRFKSRDGTLIQGQLLKPLDYVPGRRYPTIVWIHGGPNGQDQHELIPQGYSPSLERQLFAANGYAVLAVNYRGSTGRGQRFQQAIFADWGHKEVEDILAAVDDAVAKGIADPAKLGIGGWSYGGILTDYSIASDRRFKAAISGAGSGNQASMYGHDQYILQYDSELGAPWKATDRYLKLSYPFFHADRIHTPTLFVGGDRDFNVPIVGGEQMYQALRTLGVPTQLVVYPGEFHVLTRPSFLKDRADRYLAWFDRYLKDAT